MHFANVRRKHKLLELHFTFRRCDENQINGQKNDLEMKKFQSFVRLIPHRSIWACQANSFSSCKIVCCLHFICCSFISMFSFCLCKMKQIMPSNDDDDCESSVVVAMKIHSPHRLAAAAAIKGERKHWNGMRAQWISFLHKQTKRKRARQSERKDS